MGTAALTILGSASGYLMGAGIASVMYNASATTGTALALAASQAAVAGVLIATHGMADVSTDDVSLIGMVAGYASAFTFLVVDAAGHADFRAVLFAPLGGMVLGALLATQIHMPSNRVFKLTALPMGAGLLLYTVGVLLTSSPTAALGPISAIIAMVATFALTAIFTQPDAAPAETGHAISFGPVLVPAFDRKPVALGPGLVGHF
jgi:hypothetical protein